jgi:imidazolonepropionase-like amidohydrolase
MPGMVEAHTHFSWNDAAGLSDLQRMPLEEHVLWSASVAKRYLEAGWTSCVGAACAKPRLDVVTRNAINEGLIPGPRYLAASQEITVVGGLGDETLPHLPFPEFSFGVAVTGPEEMRRAVRMFLKYGVDSIKLNLSGDNFMPSAPAGTTWMSDEEVAVAVKETKMRGKRVAAHARSGESIKQCVRHGIEIIYHASFTDDEALDMLEANRDHGPGRSGGMSSTSCPATASPMRAGRPAPTSASAPCRPSTSWCSPTTWTTRRPPP